MTAKLVVTIASTTDEAWLSLVSKIPDLDAIRAEYGEASSVHIGELSPTSSIMKGVLRDGNESLLKLDFKDVTEAISQLHNLASQIHSPKIKKDGTDIEPFKDEDDARTRAEMQGFKQMLLQSRRDVGDQNDVDSPA